mmetsp:Transcript_41689/g.66206  ORF Transcript_41689/g.66206 Transcript_41689/m.66206 type:complete len:485 (-) Transcript_41689:114-1568(-)
MDMDWGLGGLEIDSAALDGAERSTMQACSNMGSAAEFAKSDSNSQLRFGQRAFDLGLEDKLDTDMFGFSTASQASMMQMWSLSEPAATTHSPERRNLSQGVDSPAFQAGTTCRSQADDGHGFTPALASVESSANSQAASFQNHASSSNQAPPSNAPEMPSQRLDRLGDNENRSLHMWGAPAGDVSLGNLQPAISAPSQPSRNQSSQLQDSAASHSLGRSENMWGAMSSPSTSGLVQPREQHSFSQSDELQVPRNVHTSAAQLVCSERTCQTQAFAWGCGKDDEACDESVLLLRCQQEGPPGPAGASLALPGYADHRNGGASSHAISLRDSVGWLCALKALNLPFNPFHLGASCTIPACESALAKHNLAMVRQQPNPQKRWDLVVLVRQVQLVAGEIDVLFADPTGEMEATVDRRVALAWPRAANEGTALLLTGVVAIWANASICRLLIMEKNVVRVFCSSDARPDEAESLRAEARANLSGSSLA